jgi:hypothetical protein
MTNAGDNYESGRRIGYPLAVIAVVPDTQERMPRRSARPYAEIARANVIAEEMVENKTPQVKGQVFLF